MSSQPGFKLLSQEDLARAESQDDVIVVEVADDEEPRLLDIPRDTSGKDQPFFKLPLPDEAEEDEYDDVVIIAASDEVSYDFLVVPIELFLLREGWLIPISN